MKHVISIVNQKGGVGKSTTALTLAEGLKRRGHSVLVVDMDAQANLTYAAGADKATETAYNAMTKGSIEGLIVPTASGVDLLPGGDNLAAADQELARRTGREYLLREALQGAAYDYVIIDTPPALGTLTVNSLTASTGVIITAQADIYSVQGIASLSETLTAVRKYCNGDLKVLGLLLVRYNGRASISKAIREELGKAAAQMGASLYPTPIRECVAVKEAQLMKQSIYAYAPRSNAVQDYGALVDAVISQTRGDNEK